MARRKNYLPDRPDRISGRALAGWLQANDVSLHTLAKCLGVAYGTANNWLRGYSVTPGWLEVEINRTAELYGKYPSWGAYREPEAPAGDAQKALDEAMATPLPGEPTTCECGAPLAPDGQCSNFTCPYQDDLDE